jgi:hypothetical protein
MMETLMFLSVVWTASVTVAVGLTEPTTGVGLLARLLGALGFCAFAASCIAMVGRLPT